MKQRIEWIDIAKGILIILVILGHSHVNGYVDYVIYSFHMAGFFLLSGITFNGRRQFKVFLTRKIRSLLLPYVVFSLLLIAYQYAGHILFRTNFSLVGGLLSMLFPISGREGTTVYHLWFLPCLFLAEIAVYWIVRVYIKNKVTGIGVAFAGILFSLLVYKLTGIASVISALPIAVGFMLVGVCLGSRLKTQNRYLAVVSALLFAFFTVCNYQFGAKSVDMSSMSLGIWPLFMLSGIAGSLALFSISRIWGKCRLIENIGKDSLYYYGLHYEILGVASQIRGGIIATILTICLLYLVITSSQKTISKMTKKGRLES